MTEAETRSAKACLADRKGHKGRLSVGVGCALGVQDHIMARKRGLEDVFQAERCEGRNLGMSMGWSKRLKHF